MALVIAPECCFSTPRIIMQKWRASQITPTPSGLMASCTVCATCCVSRSRVLLLHTPHHHAELARFADPSHSQRLDGFLPRLRHLLRQPLPSAASPHPASPCRSGALRRS